MSLQKALTARVKGVKKKVIGAVSDTISAPARAYYGAKAARSGREADTLRKARAYDDAPDFDSKGAPTEALKTRTMANAIRDRLKK